LPPFFLKKIHHDQRRIPAFLKQQHPVLFIKPSVGTENFSFFLLQSLTFAFAFLEKTSIRYLKI